MTMKKSMIAVAVAGAVGAPMSAAQAAEAYGFINVGVDAVSKDGPAGNEGIGAIPNVGGFATADLIFAAGNDGSTHLSDTAESRFGFKGSEDLGNGLTAGYRFEFGLGTEAFGGGAVQEDQTPSVRLANVSLSGDFGTLKAGTQWGMVYEYLGWNVFRSDSHGGSGWYYATIPLDSQPGERSGLRVDDAVSYTYGAGGYGSDPFTFSVQAGLAPDSGSGAGENDATFDFLTVAAQATFGDFQVNGVAYSESDESTGASEPSLTGIGARWNAGDLYVGGVFFVTDSDSDVAVGPNAGASADDLETLQVLATYDFGGGNSGMAGFSVGDSGNREADMSGIFLQFQRQLSSRTKVYVEAETAEVDNANAGADDFETSIVSLNLKHSF